MAPVEQHRLGLREFVDFDRFSRDFTVIASGIPPGLAFLHLVLCGYNLGKAVTIWESLTFRIVENEIGGTTNRLMLTLDGWIAVITTLLVFAGLQLRHRAPADVLFLGGLMLVTLFGVITPKQALEGFANPAVLTIAGLLVVSAGLSTTGVADWIGVKLLGWVRTEHGALRTLAAALVPSSAFVLNTPLVAMMMPVALDWCRKRGVSPSKILIPVSYLAILGGVCTLVGTSTSLVVNAKLATLHQQYLQDSAELPEHQAEFATQFVENTRPMGLFEMGRVGLPCALVGSVVLLLAARYLLPDRREVFDASADDRREYLVEMLVQANCRLINQSVEAAGLRQLPGLFLIEINRHAEVITPVTPKDVIRSGDRLVFTGVVTTIVDLEKIAGLVPAADTAYEVNPRQRRQRHLTEVVLSRTSPVIGRTVRESSFRDRYNAAVVAVHRNGVRLTNKIGNIILEPGDTLLLQTGGRFVPTYRNSRDFFLVSAVDGSLPRRHDKAFWAAILGLVMILWLSLTSFLDPEGSWSGFASPAVAAIVIAGLMVASRCLPLVEARAAIDLPLLMTIAGALGLGTALQESHAAESIADALVGYCGTDPWLLLLVTYSVTVILTEMITNNAVAAIMIPIAVAIAWTGQHNPRPFIMAIALAASLSFITPIGYQTNLMVMGPGNYRPPDYLRVGLPLAICVGVTAVLIIPQVWPF